MSGDFDVTRFVDGNATVPADVALLAQPEGDRHIAHFAIGSTENVKEFKP